MIYLRSGNNTKGTNYLNETKSGEMGDTVAETNNGSYFDLIYIAW
jgi:hypothetical protein